jgi:hypothetical protein
MKLTEAMAIVAKAVEDTEIAINFDKDGVEIHWYGVTQIDCTSAVAAKVVPSLRQLEAFGMKDC